MPVPHDFVSLVKGQFRNDFLTFQKAVATTHPENVDEATRIFQLASSARQQLYITGFGNNIDPRGEPFLSMVSVRTDRLNTLLEVKPDDFYIKVGSGYPLRELNIDLAPHGLYFPLADLPYVGSVGGAIAVNLSGDLSGQVWPMKKYLLAGEIVLPNGEAIRPGSVAFKSVSGYDIVKLFAPSWGQLGLLVTVSLRVLPLTARQEYESLTMRAVDRIGFWEVFDPADDRPDAVYARKIKQRFDPQTILPLIDAPQPDYRDEVTHG